MKNKNTIIIEVDNDNKRDKNTIYLESFTLSIKGNVKDSEMIIDKQKI